MPCFLFRSKSKLLIYRIVELRYFIWLLSVWNDCDTKFVYETFGEVLM